MTNALLSILENPSVSSSHAFKRVANTDELADLAAKFKEIRSERLAALKALQPKPVCPDEYARNFPDFVSKTSGTLDFARHLVKLEIQDLQSQGGERYLRRDELVDLFGRIEAARALLKQVYTGAVSSGTTESQDILRWNALEESQRRIAEGVIGYFGSKNADWVRVIGGIFE